MISPLYKRRPAPDSNGPQIPEAASPPAIVHSTPRPIQSAATDIMEFELAWIRYIGDINPTKAIIQNDTRLSYRINPHGSDAARYVGATAVSLYRKLPLPLAAALIAVAMITPTKIVPNDIRAATRRLP
jgi:hypothetical protein